MKKLILAFLAVGAVASAQAQKAGSILLYGQAGVVANRNVDDFPQSQQGDDEVRTTTWFFTPGVGFQFNRNWTVGVNFGIGGTRVVTDDNTVGGGDFVSKNRFLAVGPFMRYTMPFNRTFFAFHQLDLSYLNAKYTQEIPAAPDVIDRADGFRAAFAPSLGINVTHCIALNFGIGGVSYTTLVTDFDDASMGENRNNTFAITFGRQFNWGISANLGGYKHRGHGEPGMESRRMNAYDEDDSDDAPKRKKKASDDDDE